MMYLFICIFLMVANVTTTMARSGTELFMDFDQKEPKIKSSHWIFYLHADAIKLKPLTQYQMSRKEIVARDEIYFGGGPGIARRWSLGFPLSTITEINGYFWNNSEIEAQKPTAQDLSDYEVMRSEVSDQIYGFQISQSLNLNIETKWFIFGPFVQMGIGMARAKNKLKYRWDTNINTEYEYYSTEINEDIVTQSLSAGIELIGYNGFISYAKVQKNVFTVGTRKTETERIDVGPTAEVKTSANEKINSNQDELSFGVGFGYIF